MTRLKITWKWNGEKIREEPEEMVDANMEAPGTSKWTGPDRVVLNKAVLNRDTPRDPARCLKIEHRGRTITLRPPERQENNFIAFTNILYQSLEGEVGCG